MKQTESLSGSLFAAFLLMLLLVSSPLSAATINVSAQTNIFGAGIASPPGGGLIPPSITFAASPGQSITFPSVTGLVSPCSPVCNVGGDGSNPGTVSTNFNAQGGISALIDDPGPVFFLVGVFLTNGVPTAPAPAVLMNFTGAENFTDLSPDIAQVFFIGDGLTGTGSGQVQTFHVPNTATRLFLGFADGNAWHGDPMFYQDNSGSLTVEVNVVAATVPEPASIALSGLGFVALFLARLIRFKDLRVS